ncbi:MAG: hypothetical protein IKT95_07580 [Spirochaetales bacterium]|nr:hypothetical protein [Spirochaetales bacterium]
MKKIIGKQILLVFSLIAVLFCFASCKQTPPPEKGSFSVTITEATENSPASYRITVKNSSGKTLASSTVTELTWSAEVESGVLGVAVEALSSDSKVVGYGYVTANVESDKANNVEVTTRKLVFLTTGSTTTGYNTLEEAVAAAVSGSANTILINGEVTAKSTMTLTDTNLTLTNYEGVPAKIIDGVTTVETDTGSTSNQVARMFQINGSSEFVVTGNTSGKLIFEGAGQTSAATTACNRRVLFFLGTKNAEKATGSVTVNEGVEVYGIYCEGATSFGTVVRGYGNVTINGGYFHDNFQNGNGLFCVYATTVVNGGRFENNESLGSSAIIQNAASGANLTINNGEFRNNKANYACVITVAGATTTVNGGVFSGNTAGGDNRGAALHGNNDATVTVNINGGKFSNNWPYDYYRNKSTLTVAKGVTLNTN